MQRPLSLLTLFVVILLAMLAPAQHPLAAQDCVNDAELVEQFTDPASARIAPDTPVTVEWTLRNSGDCTWSRSYRLIFISGDRLDGPRTVRLRSTVKPGNTLTLSLELMTPELSDAGAVETYSGTWRMRDEGGDSFGPDLSVNVQVGAVQGGEDDIASVDVVLPEVLVFGGMGAGDDPNVIALCAEGGELPATPTMFLDQDALEWRYTTLYICSLPEGTEILVEITDPLDNTFSQSYVEDAPVTGVDEDDNEYTGTVLQVFLTWLKQSPEGAWQIQVTGQLSDSEAFDEQISLLLPPPPVFEGDDYPQLDNWPVAPIDPFAAAKGCHYSYLPGQEMIIGGSFLPSNTQLPLGIYQDRLGQGYLVDQMPVQTGADGTFAVPFVARDEPGSYNLVMLQEIVPEGFLNEGEEYDPGYGGNTAFSCFTVALAEEPDYPLRLAFASGDLGASDIQVFDLVSGIGYYPTYASGTCDTSDPTWWPDEEWIVYQSNCIQTETEEGWIEWAEAENYDLYASMIDPTYTLPVEETLVQLTQTPEVHETEADVNLDGVIVYRETPVGDSLDAGGDLRVLDIFEESDVSLGIIGRAPAWSPDGTAIAYMSDVEGSWQIYIYDLEDDEISLVSKECATHCRLPAWSPNGRQIIYHASVSLEDFTPQGLWIASVTGLSKPRLFLAGEYGRPSWSSEGWIVFQGTDGIYRATTDREPFVERYLLNPEWAIYWSPDWSH